jgi:hypothetical protein
MSSLSRMRPSRLELVLGLTAVLTLAGTPLAMGQARQDAGAAIGGAAPVAAVAAAAATDVTKLLVIVEENHSLAQMQAGMPYLYGLGKQYAYATNYTAVTHPSEPNYLAILAGDTLGDTRDHNPAYQVSGASSFGAAVRAGRTAKLYAETMPTNCQQTDTSGSANYAVKHNPWASFRDERTACRSFDVPLGSPSSGNLHNDTAAGRLPTIGMVVPNQCNDAHNCSLATADNWLKGWLPQLMAGPTTPAAGSRSWSPPTRTTARRATRC